MIELEDALASARRGELRGYQVLVDMVRDPGCDLGSGAAEVLGELGEKGIAELAAVLEDRELGVTRGRVIEPLTRLGDSSAMRIVAHIVTDASETPNLRRYTVFYLGRRGGADAVKPLIAALTLAGNDSSLRFQIAIALGETHSIEAVKTLESLLTDATAVYPGGIRTVREAALYAISHLQDAEAVKDLVARFATDDGELQNFATWVLARYR